MENKPLVTVVTVTYNAEKFLERTIKSVIEQDYKNIEYIIIDGGSTDGTIDIIKKYEKHVSYWISESDEGIYYAMNKGIDIATGKWINFMNAGDSFAAYDAISYIISYLKRETQFITGNRYSVYENSDKKILSIAQGANGIENHGMPSGHQSMFIKNTIMKKYKYSTLYKYASDHELMLRLYSDGINFEVVDKVISNYLRGGYSDVNNHEVYIEILYLMIKYKPNNFNFLESSLYSDLMHYYPPELSFNNNINFQFSKSFNNIYDQFNDICIKYERIVIYGNGKIAKMLLSINNKKIIGILDKKMSITRESIKVYHPDFLKNLDYDIVIISVLGREKEIISLLNISLDKIFSFKLNKKY